MKVTPEKKAAFCAALVTSGGNVSRACEAIDVARLTAYRWKEADPEFSDDWERAKQAGLDALEDEARRRAFEGTQRPVFHQGAQCGTIQEYSDTLAIFLLKGGKPDVYRERADVNLKGSLELSKIPDHELDAELSELVQATGAAIAGSAGPQD